MDRKATQKRERIVSPEVAANPSCPICAHATAAAGTKHSSHAKRIFELRHCANCRFTFVGNPWVEYSEVYDEDYYRGRGSDPLVNYVNEMEHADDTIRNYEWMGVLKAVTQLKRVDSQTKWLDFGCGNGMLSRYVKRETGANVVGFEEGWIAGQARKFGNLVIGPDELKAHYGTCDVVSAIEVLEHVVEPLQTLRTIRKLLKPGGLFFYTTGNAQPHRGRITNWSYCMPEVHVSFYEPRTLELAFQRTGFRFEYRPYLDGYTDIIRFKALKSLGYHNRHWTEQRLPWSVLSRALYARMKLLRMPIAWAL